MAFSFAGATNDGIEYGVPARVDFRRSASFGAGGRNCTFALWVYPTTATFNQYLISKYDPSLSSGWAVRQGTTTNSTSISLLMDNIVFEWTDVLPDVNKWYHVVVRLTNKRLEAFKNGLPVLGFFLDISNSGIAAVVSKLTIGNRDAGSRAFAGRLERVAAWQRSLTDWEIYRLGSGAFPSEFAIGLVFDAPLRNDIVDSHGQNGVATNATWIADPSIPTLKPRRHLDAKFLSKHMPVIDVLGAARRKDRIVI